MRPIDADELEEEICKQYRHFSQRIAISPVFESIKKAPSLNLSDAVIAEVMQMDDLIRRQAVLSLAKDVTLEGGAKHRCVDATEICLLPSVQQMKDTIYRQEAIDAFKKELTVGESKGNYVTICSAVGYEGAKQILESLPSAQRKGKWLEKKVISVYENGFQLQSCKCSECDRYETSPYIYYFSEPNFCSYCGAEMAKGESE